MKIKLLLLSTLLLLSSCTGYFASYYQDRNCIYHRFDDGGYHCSGFALAPADKDAIRISDTRESSPISE